MATQSTHVSSHSSSHECSLLDADLMEDLDVNAATWSIFLNTTLQAAVHLGQDYQMDLRFVKSHLWNTVAHLFVGVTTIDFKEFTWRSTRSLCSRAHKITNAKTYIFSDSVLCVGKIGDDPIATWKSKIKWYSENNHFKELNRIDGMLKEFEGKIFPGITTLGLLEKIQSLMRDLQCEPEHFTDRNIFMSMYNDIEWKA